MSNPFEEYINGLEGKEDINPIEVAKDLFGLHAQEIGTREAKIEQLNSGLAEKDALIVQRDNEIRNQKAMNFDLSLQMPGNTSNASDEREEGEKPDGSTIRINDLLNPNVRKF